MSRLIRPARVIAKYVKRSVSLALLRRAGPLPGRIARTLSSIQRVDLEEERAWISLIEQRRAELESSTDEVEKRDYGAGLPKRERSRNEMEKGVLASDTVGHITKVSSKSPFWSLLLFRLIRDVRPSRCIEMGTAVGVSAMYQAAALVLNGEGELTTLEGSAPIASIAENNFKSLNLRNVEVVVGRFQDTLGAVLHQRAPVNYVFIDGHHDEAATLAYFEQIVPHLEDDAVMVFDDISWSEGMKKAWKAITSDPRVRISIDLGPMGVCLMDETLRKRHVAIPRST